MTFACAAIAGTVLAAVGAWAADEPKTQWDGVYTEAQAARGALVYSQYCASCHGPDLSGSEMAPALTGGEFNSN